MTQKLVSWNRLNSLFLQKDFGCTKNIKSTKSTKSIKTQPSKAQNANKWISEFFPLDVFCTYFFSSVRCKRFSAFLYLWNLVKKKNKKFKTDLITSLTLLLILRYKFIFAFTIWTLWEKEYLLSETFFIHQVF